MSLTRLLITAKALIPGTTKTRLRLRPEATARLQSAVIGDAVEKASALGPTVVAGTPADALNLVEPLLPQGVRLFAQGGGTSGRGCSTPPRASSRRAWSPS